jgi:PAS domain S-box-containing protein
VSRLTTAASPLSVCLQLTHAISRTERLDEIYEAALDALAAGLNVQRASILLFDPDGIMRFTAWRGLSDTYRNAVEGHTPWSPQTKGADPIVVPDVTQDAGLAAFLPTIRAEHIATMAFIPLEGADGVIGKFMLYYADPHELSPDELQLAGLIAAQVAFAVAHIRAHLTAEASEERLRFALDAANMGTWDWDMGAQSVRWSENVERIHGMPPGSFDGTFQSYEREIHPEDRERVLASIQRALSEGVPHEVEYRIVGIDGTVRWVEGKGRVEHGPDGRPRRMTGVCMNVTRRKHAELAHAEALEHSNPASQQLAAIVESSDDAILSMSLDGAITSWNRAAEGMFGYSASEAIGESITLIVPPDRRAEEDLVLARIRAGEPIEMETVRRRKNGTSVAISLMVSPIKNAEGHIVGASKIARDITERKKAEAALRRLSGRRLRSEDEERRRLSRELHDSTAQRLAALCMNLSVATDAAGALDRRAQRALAESATLADECLREIRTVSYLLHPPELDALGLQSALARYIDGFAQRSGISVETDVSSDLGRLPHAVETTVFRIVQECLTNIHRHSGSSTARICLRRGASDLVLEVQDSGTGLRGNAPPGVGIASMQERLQQLRGSLEISSQPGGTNVKAVIPLSRVAA